MAQVKQLEKQRPNLRRQLQEQARLAQRRDVKDLSQAKTLSSVVTISVVVHVLYNTSGQNISDAQIQSQIAVLNKDFRRANTDAGNTPAMFSGLAADAEIEFCLAQRTPEGAPTNGITRTQTNKADFAFGEQMKFNSSGGKNAWDTKQYLNIWVVKFNADEELLGFAQFPNSGPATTDGVVIDYRYFGTQNTVRPYNLGRTTTHEVGHWLNLFHIWGDDECGDDQVEDTPTQEAENTGCPTFPSASCSNSGDMFMNYMDYTNDACMNLFTKGQKNVMQGAISRWRPGLLTSKGCQPIQVPALDAALVEIETASKVFCTSAFTPTLQLRNRGSQALTTAQIQFKIDNGPAQTYTWTGNLPSFQGINLTLPEQNVAAGTHAVTFSIVSRNNSATDGDATNDALTFSFQSQGVGLPLVEGFEGNVFPPAGWQVNNPDFSITWQKTNRAAKSGTFSAVMDNLNYEDTGQADELVLPPLDLTSQTSPKLTFQMAYSLYSATGYSDTLEVLVSTDCGATYQQVYKKAGRDLVTVSPIYREIEFVPTNGQWRQETIDLSQFASSATARIKFRHVTDFENNLYLDDVKVEGQPLSAQEESAQRAVQVAPNPTTGNIQIESPEAAVKSIQVFDAVGKVVQELTPANRVAGQPITLSLQNQANGLYLVRVQTDKGVVIRRIVLAK